MSLTLVDVPIVAVSDRSKPCEARYLAHVSNTSNQMIFAATCGSSLMLALCVLFFGVTTIHWPLAGDASLIHYVVFLMDHGSSPYRDIADLNLPGSYLIDYVVMHTLGGGSLAWRLFDLALMISGSLAMVSIARPYGWFAGIFAGALLTVVHGVDGIFQTGQRDLVIAILLLVGYAALFRATREKSPRWMILFGLCAGMATTIKPTFLTLGATTVVCLVMVHRKNQLPVWAFVKWSSLGWMIPVLGTVVFLWKMRAMSAFIETAIGIMAMHAALGRKPLAFLVLHSFSPLLPLVCLWVCCLFWQWRCWRDWEGVALAIGVAHGFASYVIQGKGYPYQRYPLIALLLLVMSIDFVRVLKGSHWVRSAGWAGIAFGTLWLAPASALKASHYDWQNIEFSTMLQNDLRRLGGSNLSGQVQCVDTIGGCFDVLYTMQLMPAAGFMYDEFLFGDDDSNVVVASRRIFWRAMQAHPPKLFVVTDDSFPTGPAHFKRLEQWPQLLNYLQENYVLCTQKTPPDTVRWWSRTQPPHSYRVYCSEATER